MSNQQILWSILFLPFLTLVFMKREELKRYISVGMFSALTSTIIGDVGVTLGFWIHRETAYPLHSIMPFDIGLNMVLTMWIFKFTYNRFRTYMVTNLILDIGFAFFLFQYYFPSIGMLNLVGISPFQTYLISISLAVVLYGYQMWQEDIFAWSEGIGYLTKLQPVAAKPLPRDQEDKIDKE